MSLKKTVKTCCVACLSAVAYGAFADSEAAWGVRDSFESGELGSHWSGSAVIAGKDGQYPENPAFGYPIPSATHMNVLQVRGSAVCTNTSAATDVKAAQLDVLVKVMAQSDAPESEPVPEGMQIVLSTGTNEVDGTVSLKLYCKPRDGSVQDVAEWVTLTNGVSTGTWVRVGLNFDYTNEVCRVSLNGAPLVTSHGYRTNTKDTNDALGSWYPLANAPQAGLRISAVTVAGSTQVDDLVITNASLEAYNPYVDENGEPITETITQTGHPERSVDVPLNVVEQSGLTTQEIAAGGVAPGDSLSVLDVVEAGLEVGKGQKFEMKTISADVPETKGEKTTQNFTITFPGKNSEDYYMVGVYDNEAGDGESLVDGESEIESAGDGKIWTGSVNTTGKKTIYFKLKARQPAKQ